MIRKCLEACKDITKNIRPHTHRIYCTNLTINISVPHDGTVIISLDSDIPYILSTRKHDGMNSMLYHIVRPSIHRLQTIISDMDVVFLTGFSTGGSCAVTTACLLNHHCVNLITFGAQRCLDNFRASWLKDRLVTCHQFQGYYDPICVWPYFGYHHITHHTVNCGPYITTLIPE